MEITLTLNYRGVQTLYSQKNKQNYYKYYFEDSNGISITFLDSQPINFERGKNYNLIFNVISMRYKGMANNGK